MELQNIKQTGTWGEISSVLNENFGKVNIEIEKLNLSTSRNKGLFPSESALKAQYPRPAVGDWAIIGASVPGQIWRCETAGTWTNTGVTGGGETVNLAGYVTNEELGVSMETLHSRIDTITPKLMTEAEYQALATPDPDIWYYTYEEEQP